MVLWRVSCDGSMNHWAEQGADGWGYAMCPALLQTYGKLADGGHGGDPECAAPTARCMSAVPA